MNGSSLAPLYLNKSCDISFRLRQDLRNNNVGTSDENGLVPRQVVKIWWTCALGKKSATTVGTSDENGLVPRQVVKIWWTCALGKKSPQQQLGLRMKMGWSHVRFWKNDYRVPSEKKSSTPTENPSPIPRMGLKNGVEIMTSFRSALNRMACKSRCHCCGGLQTWLAKTVQIWSSKHAPRDACEL